jgi:hypothetical protein
VNVHQEKIMLTVHHLGISQSDRIVWLCEELAIPYELVLYERDPVTGLLRPHTRRCIRPGQPQSSPTTPLSSPNRVRSSTISWRGMGTVG